MFERNCNDDGLCLSGRLQRPVHRSGIDNDYLDVFNALLAFYATKRIAELGSRIFSRNNDGCRAKRGRWGFVDNTSFPKRAFASTRSIDNLVHSRLPDYRQAPKQFKWLKESQDLGCGSTQGTRQSPRPTGSHLPNHPFARRYIPLQARDALIALTSASFEFRNQVTFEPWF